MVGFPDGLTMSLAQARKLLSAAPAPAPPSVPGSRQGPLPPLRLQWAFETDGGAMTASIVPLDERRVLIGDQRGTAYAVDAATGKLLWRREEVLPPVPQWPGLSDGRYYDEYGRGRPLQAPTAPLSDGQGRFFVAQAGSVTCHATDDGRLLWQAEVGASRVAEARRAVRASPWAPAAGLPPGEVCLSAPAVQWAAQVHGVRQAWLVGRWLLLGGGPDASLHVIRTDLPLKGLRLPLQGQFLGTSGRTLCTFEAANQVGVLVMTDLLDGGRRTYPLSELAGPGGVAMQAAIDGPAVYVSGPQGILCVNARTAQRLFLAPWPKSAAPGGRGWGPASGSPRRMRTRTLPLPRRPCPCCRAPVDGFTRRPGPHRVRRPPCRWSPASAAACSTRPSGRVKWRRWSRAVTRKRRRAPPRGRRARRTARTMSAETELFNTEFLHRVRTLFFKLRKRRQLQRRGVHPTPAAGFTREFKDHRRYTAGDDHRAIDWRLYARLGKPFVRIFEEVQEFHVHELLKQLAALEFAGATDLAGSLRQFRPGRDRRGLVFIVSDLLGQSPEAATEALLQATRWPAETHVVHVLHPLEMRPDIEGEIRLVDVETREARRVWLTRRELARYAEAFEEFLEGVRRLCAVRRVDYFPWTTERAFEDAFLDLLIRGSALAGAS